MSLEMLRRVGRIYERYLVRQAQAHQRSSANFEDHAPSSDSSRSNTLGKGAPGIDTRAVLLMGRLTHAAASTSPRLTLTQQTLRALMHMVQFGVAYFIMLLAMYYNGYLIICILIGAFLGFFTFGWDTMNSPASNSDDVTACCG